MKSPLDMDSLYTENVNLLFSQRTLTTSNEKNFAMFI